MSINRYLEETASKFIIKGNEKESIDVSLNTFKDRMRDYFSKTFHNQLIMGQMWILCL